MKQRVTKCKGTDCPHKTNCLRFTASTKESNGIFTSVPYNENPHRTSIDEKWIKYNCLYFVGNSHLKKITKKLQKIFIIKILFIYL